jgi:DNA repair photolyase
MSRLTTDCLFLFCVAPLIKPLADYHRNPERVKEQGVIEVVSAVDRLAQDSTHETKKELESYIFEYYSAAHKLLSTTFEKSKLDVRSKA